MRIAILGAGYTGRVLAARLEEAGHATIATRSSDYRLGAPWPHGPVDALYLLAPPEIDRAVAEGLRAITRGPLVYASTTGAFGTHDDWIDEESPSLPPLGVLGAKRLRSEAALRASGELRVVRIAGIYGPGRGLGARLRDGTLRLFADAPATSRVHVFDLARILEAMIGPEAPPMIVACDERPAPTLEVARFLAAKRGLALPEVHARAEVELSPMAEELLFSGRRCRSLHRAALIGPLRYPSYVEGLEDLGG